MKKFKEFLLLKEENEYLDFTITVKQLNKDNINTFLSMLKYIEYLGVIGSSRDVTINADGDGSFRPKFEFSIDYKEKKPRLDKSGNASF